MVKVLGTSYFFPMMKMGIKSSRTETSIEASICSVDFWATADKDYIVDEVVPETIQPAPKITALDNYFMGLIALIIGIVIGVFLAR